MVTEKIATERIAKLETQVEGVKEDVKDLKGDVKEVHSRITTGNREVMDRLDHKIDELAKSDKEQHDGLYAKMEEISGRVGILERWRWMIVGGAILMGYLIGHIEFFSKFMK